ncbi:hypothetical protein BKK79_37915 (plasmid) [Cupriavidus sp. USMAA2-4]|uniref:hypothetical protein n=1 Tax=unclassified Cupriavidus TaxID=2640874 RepID=UPI0008A67A6F|nr:MULTISPECIES: hypothetical protein [unclassified Cupriavidus]AOY97701.1 hypothetical protein BKK79_37915 [Cupriavidus sp. USMAA2-4]AOZ04270.1 hypothetical protein BKK81_33300 [Cupriavidus sp. USMAHM13]
MRHPLPPILAKQARRARRNALLAAALASIGGISNAYAVPDLSMLGQLPLFFCTVAGFFNTTFLFCAGLIIIVISSIAIASSESTIMKFLSGAGIGIGLAAVGVPMLQKWGIVPACNW